MLDNATIRNSTPADSAQYFRSALETLDSNAISAHLLDAVAIESIPPTIFHIWLSVCHDFVPLAAAFQQQYSILVRRTAIKYFGKWLRTGRASEVWSALGGTQGLLTFLAEASVHEVVHFCRAVGRSSTTLIARQERRALVTELVEALAHQHFPDAKSQSHDKRPLLHRYAHMVPACTVDFVRKWTSNELLPLGDVSDLTLAHEDLAQEWCLNAVEQGDVENPCDLQPYRALLTGASKTLDAAKQSEAKESRRMTPYFRSITKPQRQAMFSTKQQMALSQRKMPRRKLTGSLRTTSQLSMTRSLPATYLPLADGSLQDFEISTTGEQEISVSMAFSLRLLREMQSDDQLVTHSFWDYFTLPLIRRLWRRRCSTEICVETLRMLLPYIERHCDSPERLDFDNGGIMAYIVRIWARDPEHLQDVFIAYLTAIPAREHADPQAHEDLHTFAALLRAVRHGLRLPLVKMILRHTKTYSVDLESDDDLKGWETQLPVHFFRVLPPPDARKLLERIIQLNPEGISIDYNGVSSSKHTQWPIEGGLTSLLLYLSRDQDGILEKAYAAVEECKKKATTSREQSDRAGHALKAIFCAIACGSLGLYRETLLWARRFNRDALTVKAIYCGQIIQAPESLDILCGIPETPHLSLTTIEDVERAVKAGNEICVLLLETACMLIREPSFNTHDWMFVTSLLQQICLLRFNRVNQLQDFMSLPEERVYQAVWRHTQETCITLEQLGHKDGNGPLRFDRLGGPLEMMVGRGTSNVEPCRPATLQFLDELAKQRDELWCSFRRAAVPDVVSLGKPWPHGLPIERLLLSVDVTLSEQGYDLPYLCSRAEDIVFMASKHAFSTTEGIESALGPFVDDWRFALKLYVKAEPSGIHRLDRARRAWTHALDNLTGTRMSKHEAIRFWKNHFVDVGIDFSKDLDWQLPTKPAPCLPRGDDASQPTDWNPDPDPTQYDAKARKMDGTALDYMLVARDIRRRFCDIESELRSCEPSSIAWKEPLFWNRDALLQPRAREAYIAAALLYLNSKQCPTHRLLKRPFPTSNDARFAALYLEDEFLERKDLTTSAALEVLTRSGVRDAVPAALTRELAREMFEALKQTSSTGLEHDTYHLLKSLARSDKPRLASDMINELVLDRLDDSSWHRQFLTKRYLGSLKSRDAMDYISRLISDIQIRLALPRPAESSHKPAIKVTTVKMLALLMANAEFIGAEFTVERLTELFVQAKHLDIRTAIVESLAQILVISKNTTLRAKVLSMFEEHVIPVAAAVNERYPMSDKDWEQAFSSHSLPELYRGSDEHEPAPILRILLGLCRLPSVSLSLHEKKQLATRVMLPILSMSAKNHQRWNTLFSQKQSLVLPLSELPAVSFKVRSMITVLFSCVEWMPASAFKTYSDFVLLNLHPPQWLQSVNQRILSDVDLRSSDDGEHWLATWNLDSLYKLRRALEDYGYVSHQKDITRLIHQPWESAVPGGVADEQVQRYLCKLADLVMIKDSTDFQDWACYVYMLKPQVRTTEEQQRHWLKHSRLVVKQIVQHLDSLRTNQWQNDPNRHPAVLPDAFPLRLWLLTYPSMPLSPDHAERQAIFVSEISSIIKQLIESPIPYHGPLEMLKTAVTSIYPADYASIAIALDPIANGVKRTLSLVDHLHAELVNVLLQGATTPRDQHVTADVKLLLQAWKDSPDEEIRMHGHRAIKQITNSGKKEQAWLREALA